MKSEDLLYRAVGAVGSCAEALAEAQIALIIAPVFLPAALPRLPGKL